MDKTSLLELNNVSYIYKSKYQDVTAINKVSHSFYSGTLHCIIGKSGSGKTTLLSLMAGLDAPTSGEIYFDQSSLTTINLDDYRKYHISVIYQDFNLFPMFNSIENVMYPIEIKKKKKKYAKEEAIKYLELMNLKPHCFKHYPHMLSGGEKQRVAIARALASNPKIIFADEPTGNLDEENSKHIVEILKNLAHEHNYCVILITHDLDIANQCDEIIQLKDGSIVNVVDN